MSKNARDNRPYVRPVTRIELPDGNFKARWIAIAVLAAIAITALGTGLHSLLNIEPGWHTVEVASKELNCSGDFTLQYDFSGAGGGAAAQLRQLNEVYRQAAEDAYRIFNAGGEGDLSEISAHPNEAVAVDPALYRALAQVPAELTPHLFLAPAAAEYSRLFLSQNDTEAALNDPARNSETAAWLGELTALLNDRTQISLELLEGSRVRLNLGDGYQAFAREYGIETFLDFGWMKNAFIADFLAQALTEQGFTNGYLASFDGFTRNLDCRGGDYALNIYARRGNDITLPARLHYDRPMALVFLRDYPMTDRDRWHYYAYETGELVTAFLDPRDAMSRCALPELVGYSEEAGCAEILMTLLPVFVAGEFNPAPLERDGRVSAAWWEDDSLRHTDPAARLELLP